MVDKMRSRGFRSGLNRPVALVSGLAALMAGACSADVSRFNLNDSPTTGSLQTTTPPEPVYGGPSGLGKSAGGSTYESARSSETPADTYNYEAPYRPVSTAQDNSYQNSSRSAQVPPVAYAPPANPQASEPIQTADAADYAPERGRSIQVQRGDTLYGLARQHGVQLSALMAANNLNSSAIKPGQTLYLPAGADATARTTQRAPYQDTVVATNAPSHWNDTYTIQSGDSLYQLSRRYNVKISELKRYNGISNPRALRPGTVLKVPGPGGADGTIAARKSTSRIATRKVRSRSIAGSPTILNEQRSPSGPPKETQVAAAEPSSATDAGRSNGQSVTVRPGQKLRESIAGSTKLRWPVRGRIVSGFGKRNDGTHNDGINVAVPLGTNIHAAEGGMVAYAGSELKGYGNLVLLRHDNGWVTAYAHADKLLVERGDRVRRGDVIARAGKTGEVAQPQVHFEVRQGQKPVDPIPFMERL